MNKNCMDCGIKILIAYNHTKRCKSCNKIFRETYNKIYKQTPEYKARMKIYEEMRRQTLRRKIYNKNFNKTPKRKEYNRAFKQTLKYKAYEKEYRKTHIRTPAEIEREKAYKKAYSKTPIGKIKCTEHSQKRNALKKGAKIKIVNYDWINERDGVKCQICGGKINMGLKWPHLKSKSYDHILPLTKGGTHTSGNLQLAHLKCNISKNNRIKNGVQQFLF